MSDWNSDDIIVTRKRFFKVKPISEITEDKGVIFEHADLKIAVFKHEDKFYAMNNWCPHALGSLYLGDIEDLPYTCGHFDELQKGEISRADLPTKPAVICPLHGWAFFLETGGLEPSAAFTNNSESQFTNLIQDTYPTKVENDYVWVQIPVQERF